MTNKNLVLTAMIFAVATMFIDQTIVALAIPSLNQDLKLSPTGSQWIVNGYLLALAALFPLGGRVADVFGHRRTMLLGGVCLRAVLGAVRRDSDRLGRRDVDHRLPRPAGRERRVPVPSGVGDRRRPASMSPSAASTSAIFFSSPVP